MQKNTHVLFTPLKIGAITTTNRVFMAPLTRLRAAEPGDLPTLLMQEYYRQRTGAGLIISEATQISAQAKGSSGSPGLHSREQIAAWQTITQAVHDQHGRMAVQLWHTGRISHSRFHHGQPPVAPSALPASNNVSLRDEHGNASRIPASMPRALTSEEIPQIIEQFRQAVINARDAGFDLVELHAANGYLLHQFLSPTANQRTDRYGGSIENRVRLVLEVIDAVCNAWQPDRIAIRISPLGVMNEMDNGDDQQAAALYLIKQLAKRQLAYLHIAEPEENKDRFFSGAFRQQVRDNYTGVLVGAGGYTPEMAAELISKGYIDAAAFGRAFIANPDLPERFRQHSLLNTPHPETFFAGQASGYIDYPTLPQVV